jgi:hypothetical protein
LVIEPHADDAFLSLGAHIEEWVKAGYAVTIITMLGFMSFNSMKNPVAVPGLEEKRLVDAEAYAKAVGASWMTKKITDPFPAGQIIVPLGFVHADHMTVRNALEGPGTWYYVDQPYAITQKSSPALCKEATGMKFVSYRKPSIRKYRHIPLFRNQHMFFHFNPAEKLRETFELILEKI